MENTKSENVQIRADAKFKALMQRQADSYGFSMSAYVRWLVMRDAEKYKDIDLQPASNVTKEVVVTE